MIDVRWRFPLEDGYPRLPMYIMGVTVTVIHHTAVDPRGGEALLLPAGDMSQEDELAHISVIHLYHKSKGYGGFGYHGITFPGSGDEVGRSYYVTPLTRMGAHVGGNNGGKWGWALAGDFRTVLPGDAQIEGVRDVVVNVLKKPLEPHSAYGGTTCPGRVVEVFDRLEGDMDEVQVRAIFAEMIRPLAESLDGLLCDFDNTDDKVKDILDEMRKDRAVHLFQSRGPKGRYVAGVKKED